MKRKIMSLFFATAIICTGALSGIVTVQAAENPTKIVEMRNATMADPLDDSVTIVMPRIAQDKSYTIPGSKGKITSNAWRTNGNGKKSGNTQQWSYQVSADYSGSKGVSKIRTTWRGSASMRNGGSLDLGISNSGGSVGGSSSWANVSTVSKYWENSNGSKNASYASNMVATPSKDYRTNTISMTNEAKVTLKGDPKPYSITSSV